MVCISKRKINGGGVLDSLMRPFTVNKYGNERHARSLDPNHFMQGYSFVGPATEVKLRNRIGDNIALNDLDRTAEAHDRSYLREKEEYERDHNKPKHIKNVWRADDVFIDKARNSKDDPIMGKITSKLMATKKGLEVAQVLPTTTFSGFGAEEEITDPVARLRKLAQKESKPDKKNSKKVQKGGFLPLLAPVGIAIASAVGSKLAGDLYDFIKSKITGSGYKVPHHKTKAKRVQFVKEIVNSIE